MKRFFRILVLIILITLLAGIYCSRMDYDFPAQGEVNKKLNYFERIINKPLDYKSELFHVGNQNPEWMLFSLSFSSYAFTNIYFLDSTYKKRASVYIDKAIQKALTDTVYKYFYTVNPVNSITDSTGSVLYLGHLNLMLGCCRLISGDSKYNLINEQITEMLYKRYRNSKSMCLESYPHSIWIPYNSVAMASINLYAKNTEQKRFTDLCSDWISFIRTNYTEKESQLLYSTIDYTTGKAVEEPRGSMIGWTILFISRFDKNFGKELYENYKNNFSSNVLFFRLFKERMKDSNSNVGDIDSGPLLMGYSIPANAWAFGNAVFHKDLKTAAQMRRLIRFGSKTIDTNDEIRYDPRFVDMNISPLAEALVLYMETMRDWR